MEKAFSRVNWENEPSVATPLNQTNLNKGDSALDAIDNRVVAMDSRLTNLEGYEPTVLAYAQRAETGAEKSEGYAIGKHNGTDVPSTDPAYHNNSLYYATQAAADATSAANSKLDSEAYAVGKRNGSDVGSSDETYHNNSKYYSEQASSSATTSDSRAEDSEAWAVGKRDGVDVGSSDATYHNNSKYYAGQSESYVEDSEAYALGTRGGTDVSSGDVAYHNNSKYYSEQSSSSATAADGSAEDAEAYAVGKRGGVDVTSSDVAYHNNAKYYSEQSSDSASASSTSATAASDSAEDAEAYAIGKRNGSDVSSDDPTYHNNSKYYSEQSSNSASAASTSATASATSKSDSEAYAVGTRNGQTIVDPDDPAYHNNSKYWKDQAQAIVQLDDFEGATDNDNGVRGLVPAPSAGDNHKFLCGDGDFEFPVKSVTGTLLSSGWTLSVGEYVQSVTFTGITTTTTGTVGLDLTISSEAREAASDIGLHLKSQSANTLTFAAEDEPSVNIPIVLNY